MLARHAGRELGLAGVVHHDWTDDARRRPRREQPADGGHRQLTLWFVYGDNDTAIPPKLHAFMAERAHPRATSVVAGASHVVMISHPDAVAKVIEDAANAR